MKAYLQAIAAGLAFIATLWLMATLFAMINGGWLSIGVGVVGLITMAFLWAAAIRSALHKEKQDANDA